MRTYVAFSCKEVRPPALIVGDACKFGRTLSNRHAAPEGVARILYDFNLTNSWFKGKMYRPSQDI